MIASPFLPPVKGAMFDESRGLSLEPNRSSRHTIGIHATPAEVYHALTDATELGRWFVAEASVDLRPGGAYRWVFGEATGAPGRNPQVSAGEFATVVKDERLGLRAIVDDIETTLEFRLDRWRDGTLLTITHEGFPGEEDWDETFRAIDRSWEMEVYVLKIYLERARGMVRMARFHETRLPAAPEAVFDAFTTGAGLRTWLADRATAEPEPGSAITLEWDGQPDSQGHFAVCDPDAFLLMTWEGDRPSLVSIALDEATPEGDAAKRQPATELRLEHRLFAPDASRFKIFDWESALQRLSHALSSGKQS